MIPLARHGYPWLLWRSLDHHPRDGRGALDPVRRITAALLQAVVPPMPAPAMFDFDPIPLMPRVRIPVLAITSETDSLSSCHERVLGAVPGARGHRFDCVHPLYSVARAGRAGEYVSVVADFFSRSLA